MFELKCKKCGQFKPGEVFRKYKVGKQLCDTCLDCRKLPCECGCGDVITGYFSYSTKQLNRFILGHSNRLPENKLKMAKGRSIAAAKGSYKKSNEWKAKASLAKMGSKNPMYGNFEHLRAIASVPGSRNGNYGKSAAHGKGQWFTDRHGKVIWMRSSWEVKFAEWLDGLGLTWSYEPERFNLGEQTYAPDFWVEEFGCFWEVKGWLHERHARTIKLFREQYPGKPLVVATKPVMRIIFGRGFK